MKDNFDPLAILLRLERTLQPYGPRSFQEYERDAGAKPGPAGGQKKPVIYTLTVKCVSGRHLEAPCARVIEMKDDSTLADLHDTIQGAVEFDSDHPFEFFIGRGCRNQQIVFGDSDDWGEVRRRARTRFNSNASSRCRRI